MGYRKSKDSRKKRVYNNNDDVIDHSADDENNVGSEKKNSVPVETTLTHTPPRQYPAWTQWVYDKGGYLAGVITFGLFVLLVWPIVLSLMAAVLSWIATAFIGSLPDAVITEMGLSAPIMMPVIFLVIVIALLTAAAIKGIITAGGRYTKYIAKGLFAGQGETWRQNRARRKAHFAAKRNDVAQQRAARKAKKNQARSEMKKAKKDNPAL